MPITITHNLTAVNTPTPAAPPTPSIGAGSSGPFSTGMTVGTSNRLNQIAAMLTLIGQAGSGGYAVVSGLDLSAGTGLNVVLSTGIALLDGLLELVSSSPTGLQGSSPPPYTLPDSSTSYVWLTDAGALTAATSITPPTGAKLYLGNVTTLSGAITAIDYSGRVKLQGGQFWRQTADLSTPGDSPGFNVLTRCTVGDFLWDGEAHKILVDLTKQLPAPTNQQTISTTLALTATSANNQYLTASGGNQTVELPDPATIPLGWSVAVFNAGASNNLLLKDHTGATTYATITPGEAVACGTVVASGSVAFPSSMTAATPAGGAPPGPI